GQINTFDDDVDEAPVQDLALNEDNVFQADQCDAFDFDVDEATTAQTMFMENLSLVDPIYDEAGSSYDSDILSEVQDHDNYVDSVGEYHEENEMQNDVQPNYVVDSNIEYTSDSNIIMYEHKSMVEEVMTLKKDFKQKENKYLEAFLDMKALKEKEKVAIGYKNPLYLTRAKQVQPALYNGHELIKTNHTHAVVHVSEDTLDIAEKTKIEKITVLQEQNELFRAENETIKQHYKELYNSIRITCSKTVEKTTALLAKNKNLKAQITEKIKCVTMDSVKPKVLAPGMNAIDVEPIPPCNRNNREVHLDYLKYLKESVETVRGIVEEARIEKSLDNALGNACFYTKRYHELLEYVIGTCPKEFNKRDKKTATTPLNRKKHVPF
nr:integrase, catalytic region, zinc finger, CCHC-type, peptidase aspartic, catalytic [Tanacetum cinerariifolium]